MSYRRMLPFLLINIIVSATVVLAILWWWDGRNEEPQEPLAAVPGVPQVDIPQVETPAAEPAPVELVEFQGQALSREVLLTFSTRSEENNNYFEIERSRNSQNPQIIGMVEGNGTTQDYIRYTFKDSQPLPQAYYRLKQVDYNGDFEYSDWIFVKLDEADITNKIKVYPTIANNSINIVFNTPVAQKSQLMISDVSGNKIYSESFLGDIDVNNYLTYNVEDLLPGIYIVQLTTGIESSYTKFIVTD